MAAQNVVYANLAGQMAQQARVIVEAMQNSGLKRLTFISLMVYGEVPGQAYGSVLDPCRDSAAIVEASGLDYMVLRPGWFTQQKEVDYEIMQKGEVFRSNDVSLDNLSDLITKLVLSPTLEVRRSLGREPRMRRWPCTRLVRYI